MCACKPGATCSYHNSKLWSAERRAEWNAYRRARYVPKGRTAVASESETASERGLNSATIQPPLPTPTARPLAPWEGDFGNYEEDSFEDVRDFGGFAYYKEGEKLFHGSPVDLEIGAVIQPETRTGFAYATPDLDVAAAFSSPISNRGGVVLKDGSSPVVATGRRFIYEVEPVEPEMTYHIKFGLQGDFTKKSSLVFAANDQGQIVGGSQIETINTSGYRIVGKREVTGGERAE